MFPEPSSRRRPAALSFLFLQRDSSSLASDFPLSLSPSCGVSLSPSKHRSLGVLLCFLLFPLLVALDAPVDQQARGPRVPPSPPESPRVHRVPPSHPESTEGPRGPPSHPEGPRVPPRGPPRPPSPPDSLRANREQIIYMEMGNLLSISLIVLPAVLYLCLKNDVVSSG